MFSPERGAPVAPTGVSRSRALTSFLPPIRLSLKDSIACKKVGRESVYHQWAIGHGHRRLDQCLKSAAPLACAARRSSRFNNDMIFFPHCHSFQVGNALDLLIAIGYSCVTIDSASEMPLPASGRRVSCEGFVSGGGLHVLHLTLIMSFIFPFLRRLSSLRCCRG